MYFCKHYFFKNAVLFNASSVSEPTNSSYAVTKTVKSISLLQSLFHLLLYDSANNSVIHVGAAIFQ